MGTPAAVTKPTQRVPKNRDPIPGSLGHGTLPCSSRTFQPMKARFLPGMKDVLIPLVALGVLVAFAALTVVG